MKAVGHTGTLDPFASGLLVILLGRATRLAQFVERHDKTYLATAKLGVRTTTDDLTGEIISLVPPLRDAETGQGVRYRAAEPSKQPSAASSARKSNARRRFRRGRSVGNEAIVWPGAA